MTAEQAAEQAAGTAARLAACAATRRMPRLISGRLTARLRLARHLTFVVPLACFAMAREAVTVQNGTKCREIMSYDVDMMLCLMSRYLKNLKLDCLQILLKSTRYCVCFF